MSLTITVTMTPSTAVASITQHEGERECMKYTTEYIRAKNEHPIYFAHELLREPAAKRFIGTAKYEIVHRSEECGRTVYTVELYNKYGTEIDKPTLKKDSDSKKPIKPTPPIEFNLFELYPIITIILTGTCGRAILKGNFNGKYTVYEKYYNDIGVMKPEQTIAYNFLMDNDVIQFIGTYYDYKLYVIDNSRNFCAGLGETCHTRYLVINN